MLCCLPRLQDDWLKRAELAVSKGEDELAREALKRRKAYQDNADGMRVQLEAQQKAVDQLIGNTRCGRGCLRAAMAPCHSLQAVHNIWCWAKALSGCCAVTAAVCTATVFYICRWWLQPCGVLSVAKPVKCVR